MLRKKSIHEDRSASVNGASCIVFNATAARLTVSSTASVMASRKWAIANAERSIRTPVTTMPA
ncbi:hypothetical protein D3C86_2142490 [compost metagenome]